MLRTPLPLLQGLLSLWLLGALLACGSNQLSTVPASPTADAVEAAPITPPAPLEPTAASPASPGEATPSPAAASPTPPESVPASATSTATGSEAPPATLAPLPDDDPFEGTTLSSEIVFAPGESSAIVENAVVRGTRNRHLLRAEAGQQMRIELASPEGNAEFTLHAPDGQRLTGPVGAFATTWEGDLPQSGAYTVTVYSSRGNASYSLLVTILPGSPAPPDPASTPTPQAIQFEPGSTAATRMGQLRGEYGDRYTFEASAGQWLLWLIQSSSSGATTQLLTPAGPVGEQALAVQGGPAAGVGLLRLPATQAYELNVLAMGDAAATVPYTLTTSIVTVEPQRLQFSPGSSAGAVSGTLDALEVAGVALGAAAGQQMTLTVTPASSPLVVAVVQPNGATMTALTHAAAPQLATGLPIALPETGDYTIVVAAINGSTPYELAVVIR